MFKNTSVLNITEVIVKIETLLRELGFKSVRVSFSYVTPLQVQFTVYGVVNNIPYECDIVMDLFHNTYKEQSFKVDDMLFSLRGNVKKLLADNENKS